VVRGGTYSKFKVDAGKKYFVNVGAVGQPRDNNPKAAYVVYDVYEGTIELRRLDYDIAKAHVFQKKPLGSCPAKPISRPQPRRSDRPLSSNDFGRIFKQEK
jgi:diadenosine tetraphosphatase ApaH/serine/threonine PP2A family protein phosphatase